MARCPCGGLMKGSIVLAGLLMALSALIGATDAVIVRVVGPEMHVFQITFFRNFFSLLVLLPFLLRRGGVSFSSRFWGVHAVRAALKLGAMIAYFLAILRLPLAVVMAIAFTAPLFTTAGGILFLGERLSRVRVLSGLLGLAGVLIVLRPGAVPLDGGVALAFASAMGLGVVAVLMKASSGRERASQIVLFNLVLVVPIAFAISLPVWTFPSPEILGLLAVQGALGALGQLCVAKAMSMADAAAIIPIDFIRLPLVIVLGVVLFAESTGWPVFIGGTIIFAAVLLQMRSERATALTAHAKSGEL